MFVIAELLVLLMLLLFSIENVSELVETLARLIGRETWALVAAHLEQI